MPKFSSHYAGLAEGDLDGPALDARYAPIAGDDEAYGAGWNGATDYPTKNAVYDKVETLGSGGVGGSDTVYFYVQQAVVSTATFTGSFTGITGARCADSVTSVIQFHVMVPDSWTTFNADLIYYAETATTGDVRWDNKTGVLAVGDTASNSVVTGSGSTVAAPTQNVVSALSLLSGATRSDAVRVLYFRRNGGDGADTYAGNILVLGVRLTKAS